MLLDKSTGSQTNDTIQFLNVQLNPVSGDQGFHILKILKFHPIHTSEIYAHSDISLLHLNFYSISQCHSTVSGCLFFFMSPRSSLLVQVMCRIYFRYDLLQCVLSCVSISSVHSTVHLHACTE